MTTPTPALRILIVRGQRVLLDADLARLYGVETRALNQAVKRHPDRFPSEFAFQLTSTEQAEACGAVPPGALTSQLVISKPARGGRRYLAWVFTEHGALQAAGVLNSPEATRMSVAIIRAFVKMRETAMVQTAVLKRLSEIDKTLLLHDTALQDVYRKLLPLLAPPADKPKRRIGFRAD